MEGFVKLVIWIIIDKMPKKIFIAKTLTTADWLEIPIYEMIKNARPEIITLNPELIANLINSENGNFTEYKAFNRKNPGAK
jgi:hypothetical protein